MELTLPLPVKQAASIRLARESRIAVWEGAVRSGKTIVSLIAWIDYIQNAPPGPLLMAGRTQDTLRRNCIDPMQELLGAGQMSVNWGDGKATLFGRTIHLVGADNTSAESRIRGLTLAGAYVDELTILGGPYGREWFQMLLTRMSVKGARILATTNPGSPYHWLLEDFLDRAEVTITTDGRVERDSDVPEELKIHRYRFVLDDNPTLDPAYVASLKSSLQGMFYRRFILGEWVAAEASIYPMLDPTVGGKHVLPADTEIPRLFKTVIGIDHGTTNPTHAVRCGVDEQGIVWVTGECRLTDQTLTPNQQAQQLWDWVQTTPVIGDSDWNELTLMEKEAMLGRIDAGLALSSVGEIPVIVDPSAKGFRNAWHAVTGRYPRSADNSVLAGISDVSTLLGQGRIKFIDGHTPYLLRELSGYSWDAKAQERGVDAPMKKDDHGADALRYAIRSLRVSTAD